MGRRKLNIEKITENFTKDNALHVNPLNTNWNLNEENVDGYGFDDWNHYYKTRDKFIIYCRKKGVSYADLAMLTGLTRQRIFTIARYGMTGKLTRMERYKILDRDEGKCRICKTTKRLHIHHVMSPKSKNPNNLVTLCASCHVKWEAYTKSRKAMLLAAKEKKKLSPTSSIDGVDTSKQ